mgnify:CR=1 FL=1
MPKASNEATKAVCENLLNRSLANLASIERRWRGLSPEQKHTILAALRQAVERVSDADNRSSRVTL